MVVLIIIEELMSKTQDEFLDNFARLGVFSKVQALIGSPPDAETDVIRSTEAPQKGRPNRECSETTIKSHSTIKCPRRRQPNRCEGNTAGQGVPLARVEHLSRSRLPVRVVRFGRSGTVERLERLVPLHTRRQTGDHVLERQSGERQ